MAKKARTPAQKAADKKRSAAMKGKRPGGKATRSTSPSTPRRSRRAPKKTWGGAATKIAQGAAVVLAVKGGVQNYREARNAKWGRVDSAVYGATGVRKLSGQFSGEVKPGLGDGESIDYKAAARSPAALLTAAKEGPKVAAKIGKAVTPASLRHTRFMGRRIAN